jgi:transposase
MPPIKGSWLSMRYNISACSMSLKDRRVPIDNNWVENQIRHWALGLLNWLFGGSLRSGQRAAAIMILMLI